MRKSVIILSLFFVTMMLACTKGPGVGGRASIQGKVYAKNFNNSYIAVDSGFIAGQKVYIKYGDLEGVGDDVETDNTGTFVFPYLRTGKYTIYVFSKRLANNTLDSSIVQNITINDRKEVVKASQFNINTFKN